MQYKAYHKKLSNRISGFLGADEGRGSKASEYLKMAPDLFFLMLKLGLDKKIPVKFRTAVTAGLAYFILPFDLIPEALAGPAGYIDDVFLAMMIMHGIMRRFGPDLKIPEKEAKEKMSKMETLLGKAENIVGRSRWKKLNKVYKKSLPQ